MASTFLNFSYSNHLVIKNRRSIETENSTNYEIAPVSSKYLVTSNGVEYYTNEKMFKKMQDARNNAWDKNQNKWFLTTHQRRNHLRTNFRPRPIKHYRKRLIPNTSQSVSKPRLSSFETPGGTTTIYNKSATNTNVCKNNTPMGIFTGQFGWNNRT
jgi:hypothetical protein